MGWAEFAGVRVRVHPGVFVPRRRTEALVRAAVAVTRPGAVVLDLCCGTGAIGAAIAAAVPGVRLWASDVDPVAVRCARENLARVRRRRAARRCGRRGAESPPRWRRRHRSQRAVRALGRGGLPTGRGADARAEDRAGRRRRWPGRAASGRDASAVLVTAGRLAASPNARWTRRRRPCAVLRDSGLIASAA